MSKAKKEESNNEPMGIKFEFKTFEDSRFNFGGFLKEILNGVVDGVLADEVRKRLNILDKVEKASFQGEDFIYLTDSELSTVQKCLKDTKWMVIDKAIPRFEDYVNSLK